MTFLIQERSPYSLPGDRHRMRCWTFVIRSNVRLREASTMSLRHTVDNKRVPPLRRFLVLHDGNHGGFQTRGNVSPASFLVLFCFHEQPVDYYPIYVYYTVLLEIGIRPGTPG